MDERIILKDPQAVEYMYQEFNQKFNKLMNDYNNESNVELKRKIFEQIEILRKEYAPYISNRLNKLHLQDNIKKISTYEQPVKKSNKLIFVIIGLVVFGGIVYFNK